LNHDLRIEVPGVNLELGVEVDHRIEVTRTPDRTRTVQKRDVASVVGKIPTPECPPINQDGHACGKHEHFQRVCGMANSTGVRSD